MMQKRGGIQQTTVNKNADSAATAQPYDWNMAPTAYNPRKVIGKDEIKLPFGLTMDVNEYSNLVGYDATGKSIEQWKQEIVDLETIVNAELRARGAVQWAESFGMPKENVDQLKSQIKLPDDEYEALTARLKSMRRVNLYEGLRSNDAFEQLSTKGASKGETDDDTYNYINHYGKYTEEKTKEKEESYQALKHAYIGDAEEAPDPWVSKHDVLDFMTQDEIQMYNYLYEAKGKEAADNYIEYIDESLNTRASAVLTQQSEEYAREHPVLGTGVSVGYNLLSGIQSLPYTIGRMAANEEINPHNSAYASGIARDAIRAEVSKDLGPVGKFFYDAGTSVADFLSSAAFGKAGVLTTMGVNMLGYGVRDAKIRGATDREAFDYGLRLAFIEILTENMGYDAIKKTWGVGAKGWKAVGTQAVKSLFPEAAEEATSGILGDWVDFMVMQDASKWETQKRAYMAEGMSEAEAKKTGHVGFFGRLWITSAGRCCFGRRIGWWRRACTDSHWKLYNSGNSK